MRLLTTPIQAKF